MEPELKRRQNGTAMRAFREMARRSVADTAAQVGLGHHQALRNIENNSRAASLKVIWLFAELHRIPVGAITLDGTDAGFEEVAAEIAAERAAERQEARSVA